MKYFILSVLKITLGFLLVALLAGKVFYPQTLEDNIISPARKMPIFGQVLGTTWDGVGNLGPTISDKTQQLTQKIDTHDIDTKAIVDTIVNSNDPQKLIEDSIQKQIDLQTDKLKSLPDTVVESIQKEVQKQLYQQFCREYQASNSATIH